MLLLVQDVPSHVKKTTVKAVSGSMSHRTRAAELSGGGEEIPAALRGSSHGQPQKARLLKGGGEEEERREGFQDRTA